MAVLHAFRSVLLLVLATVLALTFALTAFAGHASAQLPDCPPDFPLCDLDPREPGEESPDDPADPADPGDADDADDPGAPPPEQDPQVTETPEGGVATGTGAPGDGSALPLLLLGGGLAVATFGGLTARRRLTQHLT